MSEIKIGDKVVCVDDRKWTNNTGTFLFYRNVYTVLDITTCKNRGKRWYNIGCRLNDKDLHSLCCSKELVGVGIYWVDEHRFIPAIVTFRDYCRKEVMEHMQEDIKSLVSII
ncbi:MAG: hypothetical protein RLZZ546_2630 [Bacteroidota bacterium]|jgi:hypothetical protein